MNDYSILVVDDDARVLQIVSLILEGDGYAVSRAKRVSEALDILRASPPDLILSDVMMRGVDGFSFLIKVRANPNWKHIPFIFLTAKGQQADMRMGMGLGADDYLSKPFEREDLLIAVRARLQRQAQIRRRPSIRQRLPRQPYAEWVNKRRTICRVVAPGNGVTPPIKRTTAQHNLWR